MVSVLGGFAGGIAVGMLSAGGVGDRDGEERGHARAHNDHAGSGVFEALAGVALFSIAGPIQGQFKDLASEAMQGFFRKDTAKPPPG